MNNNSDLKIYSFNRFSQNGEDGIIEEIIRRLRLNEQKENWCVEFGAWDGIYLSNTFNLVLQGWNAVYIEGDQKRFKDLLKTSKKHNNIFPINDYVSKNRESKSSLNNLLKKNKLPKNFDLLSIDIDSFDLEVWESLDNYNPKIVIIEINSSYPPGVIKWHSNKYKNLCGNSFSATLIVAKEKGYSLVCHTGNMILIKDEFIENLNLDRKYIKYPELLYDELWFKLDKENFVLKYLRLIIAFIKAKLIKKIKF